MRCIALTGIKRRGEENERKKIKRHSRRVYADNDVAFSDEFLNWIRKGDMETAYFSPISGIGQFKVVVTRIPRLDSSSRVFILLNGKILGGETFDTNEEAKERAEDQIAGFRSRERIGE